VPAKVRIFAGGRYCGYLTVSDSEPSLELLCAVFPEAEAILEWLSTGQFDVYLGEASTAPVVH
jgi:hypothetical protein